MKAKTKELWLSGLIALVVSVLSAWLTSYFTIEHKLNNDERFKLNENFGKLEKVIPRLSNQQFLMTLLLSKLVYTRKDWRPEDFREATELLGEIKKSSDIDFDAITMSLGNDAKEPCETFREFYKKNREMIHENHLMWLQGKIDHCIPKEERLHK